MAGEVKKLQFSEGVVVGTPTDISLSGTYTPTGTAGTNVSLDSDVDTFETNFTIVGKVVSIAGRIDVDPIAAATTDFFITTPTGFPIDSTVAFPIGGVGRNSFGDAASFQEGPITTEIKGAYIASSALNTSIFFTLQYLTTG